MSRSDTERLDRLEAIEAIKTLKALYCHWADRGYETAGHDADRFADLFVEDAVWQGSSTSRAVGREQIIERFWTFRPFGFHMVTNPVVEVDVEAGTATAHWAGFCPSTTPDGQALWVGGTYDDRLVRTADGWRFTQVRFDAAFRTPFDVGWARAQLV